MLIFKDLNKDTISYQVSSFSFVALNDYSWVIKNWANSVLAKEELAIEMKRFILENTELNIEPNKVKPPKIKRNKTILDGIINEIETSTANLFNHPNFEFVSKTINKLTNK
ncbi:hypothetical protein [Mycoplasma nasistruthionis]|uniref:Uncharacterized protein n=1 Tax=Mycoplasma nasistruthionis TaxID=353852 RepID=A0A4Y6I5S5_9MOLU|nr:hypothetical protein [Mycoplasma nasistruthionis]QDF64873.1 hypothetical protein FIV53_00905 [Mycoplasma nasistruthionis]